MLEKDLFELIQISLGEKKFQTEKILKSLKHKNSLVKLAALELLKDRYRMDLSAAVLKLVFDPEKKVRTKAIEILTADPFFAFEKRKEFMGVPIPPGNQRIYLEKYFSSRRTSELSEAIKTVKDSDFYRFMKNLAWIPGVENLDLATIFSDSKKKFQKDFEKFRQLYFQTKYPPQISLVPSYCCNLDCFYCYAHDLHKIFPDEMTLEQFKILLDTVNPQNVIKRVGILGGEPLIFPRLKEFINELKKRSMDFYFATNGIVDPRIFEDIITQENLLTATVHIERDDFYKSPQMEKLLTNIKKMGEKNTDVIVRYNLLDPSRREWNFLQKYMDLLPDFKFSFAVVFPSQSGQVNTVGLEKLKDFSQTIVSLFVFLKEKFGAETVKVAFSKPFPPCAFSEENFRFILKNSEYKNVCELEKNQYTNNICINPDLSFFSCMALTNQKYRGEKILALEEMKTKNKSLSGFLLKKPLLEDCEDCRLFGLGVCQAACYAYIV